MDNSDKIILDLCGGTGAWSRPYKDAGYDVRNITLPEYDVRTYQPPDNVYGILAAPPCDQFSFVRTHAKSPRNFEKALTIVRTCLDIIWLCQQKIKTQTTKIPPLKFWALENPNYGMLKWYLGKPVFIFNPYDFGDAYKKQTALWGYFNIPKNCPIPLPLHSMRKFDRLLGEQIHLEYVRVFNRNTRRAITPSGFARAFFEANQ